MKIKDILKLWGSAYFLITTGLVINLLYKLNFPWEILTILGLGGATISFIIFFIL
jgi:hypothetical protein